MLLWCIFDWLLKIEPFRSTTDARFRLRLRSILGATGGFARFSFPNVHEMVFSLDGIEENSKLMSMKWCLFWMGSKKTRKLFTKHILFFFLIETGLLRFVVEMGFSIG